MPSYYQLLANTQNYFTCLQMLTAKLHFAPVKRLTGIRRQELDSVLDWNSIKKAWSFSVKCKAAFKITNALVHSQRWWRKFGRSRKSLVCQSCVWLTERHTRLPNRVVSSRKTEQSHDSCIYKLVSPPQTTLAAINTITMFLFFFLIFQKQNGSSCWGSAPWGYLWIRCSSV